MFLDGAWLPMLLTLKVASLATMFAFVFGIAIAYVLARREFVGKEWLDALLTLPMVLPPTVLGYYLVVLLGRNGWIGHWLDQHAGFSLIFTWQGAVVAAAIVSLPLILKSARAAYEGVDRNFEDAARTLGQSEFAIFVRVTFPLAWRGILAGTLLGFARAMGEFGATLMIAGNLPGQDPNPVARDLRCRAGRRRRAGQLSGADHFDRLHRDPGFVVANSEDQICLTAEKFR